MVAVGRRPATRDLGLDTVGLRPERPIEVDEHLRVAHLPWLYAIGDANGRSLLTHVGKYEAHALAQIIDGCARHGIRGIAPWRDQVEKVGLAEAARIVRDNGLRVTDLCRGGMFPAPDATGRQRQIDDNKRAVDEAAALGADALVLVVGGLPGGSRDISGTRSMVRDGIAVRELTPVVSPLEAAFLALTDRGPEWLTDRGPE